jgi:hypothetical protein
MNKEEKSFWMDCYKFGLQTFLMGRSQRPELYSEELGLIDNIVDYAKTLADESLDSYRKTLQA